MLGFASRAGLQDFVFVCVCVWQDFAEAGFCFHVRVRASAFLFLIMESVWSV